MTNTTKAMTAILLAAALGFAGCSRTTTEEKATPAAEQPEGELSATAELSPTAGSEVEGTVTFTQVAGGVRIVAELTGLTPGEHGFHIHEHGDCSAGDASSAGAHFNPTDMPHAGPESPERHAGDLGNLTADADGDAYVDRVDPHLRLDGPHSIVGKSVIVHAGRDDLTSQPAGNAGARVACGVVELDE